MQRKYVLYLMMISTDLLVQIVLIQAQGSQISLG